jgi:hypothetical protein
MFGIRRNLRAKESDGTIKKGFIQIHELDSKSKIRSGSNDILIDPTKQMVVLTNCYLHNSSARSEKIHRGEIHKERCAWISCDSFEILPIDTSIVGQEITFNPKVNPFFALNGKNVDKHTFSKVVVTSNARIILI